MSCLHDSENILIFGSQCVEIVTMKYEVENRVQRREFDEQEQNEVAVWSVILEASEGAWVDRGADLVHEARWSDDLEDYGLTPEKVELTSVSFYVEGTYKEAFTAALNRCNALSRDNVMGASSWVFNEDLVSKIHNKELAQRISERL